MSEPEDPSPPGPVDLEASAGESRAVNLSVLRSTTAQIATRGVLAISRLTIAALIVRTAGAGRYGEFALVLVLTAIPEWIVDFGLNDIFVREVCRQPERRERLLRTLAATKLAQVGAAYAVLVALLIVMRYPAPIWRAGLIAGGGLLFHAGVLVYRALFKSELKLERDVLAELVGVVAMIPLIWGACTLGAGIEVLAVCHVFSKVVSLAVAFGLGSSRFRLTTAGVGWGDMRWGLREGAAVGVAGLLVGVYESVDALVLSKLATTVELGLYSAAQKLVWPALTGLAAVGLSLFPVLSRSFGSQPERFRTYFQGGVDAVILLAAIGLSGLAGAAEFLLGLLGPEMLPAAPLLRIFAVVCFAKAVAATVGPVLYVTGAQRFALWVASAAVLAKATLLLLLVPGWGPTGAAVATLTAEVFAGLVPTVLVVQHFARCRLRWTQLGRVGLAVVPAHAATYALGWAGSAAGGVAAAGLVTILSVATGALRPSAVRALMGRPLGGAA